MIMGNKIKFAFFVLLASAFLNAVAQDEVPMETSAEISSDSVWNKWETENFIILSLDKEQGLSIRSFVEEMRSSFLHSWGLADPKSLVSCKLICVPDKETLTKLFGIEEPRYEVRYGSEGNAISCSIWIDHESLDSLYLMVGSVSVSKSVFPLNINPVLQKGILALGHSPEHTRNLLKTPATVDPKSLFNGVAAGKTPADTEQNCALVCLLLRKEFGRDSFSLFINDESQNEERLKDVFGFSGYNELSATLQRFSKNLSEDILNKRTPDEYLLPNSSF